MLHFRDFVLESDKIFLLFLLLVLSIVYLLINWTNNFPPGPMGYPLIGNRKFLETVPHIRLTRLRDKYGDVYSIRLGKQRAVVICSLEGIMEGLVKKSAIFGGRPNGFLPHAFLNWTIDGGICFSELSMKYKIKKEFVLHSLGEMCATAALENAISREAQIIVLHLLAQKEPCDLAPVLESTMLRIMLYMVNGKMYSNTDENFNEIWRTFSMRADEVCRKWPSFSVPVFQNLTQQNTLEFLERTRLQFEYQRDIVNRHKDCFNPEIVSDIVDHGLVMLERYDDMGELDQDELDSLFVELSGSGYRQVASTLLWLILYVSELPDVQNKVYEELVTVVGKDRLPQLGDQPYLPYVCAVVLETQRIAPVMPFLYPHSTTQYTAFMGYQIPKDTIVLFNIWSLHHDPKHWKQPMKFDPNRFLKDGTLHIPEHYLPYSDGLRACPGEGLVNLQLFIFVTHILYQMRFKLPMNADLEGDFKGFVLTPKSYKVLTYPRETVVPDLENVEGPSDTVVCFLDGQEL